MKRLVTALLAVALAGPALAADGAALYASKCAMCHGKKAEGGKMAPEVIAGLPAEKVKAAILNGKGKMKPMKVEDPDAVAQYVAGLSK